METNLIYHITTEALWKDAVVKGEYIAPSLHSEGFIHCSKAEQVQGVLNRYYQGEKGLLRLTIDPQLLTAALKYEIAPSVQEAFPHVFGPIALAAVVAVEQIDS